MRVFDAGQHAHGIIAVGQFATGVIAIGQVATGVIALGQVSRGFIAIGMVSIGLFAYGMVSVGLFQCGAMVGIGGRAAFGGVLALVPDVGTRRDLPETTTLDQLYATKRWAGWIELRVRPTRNGAAFEHAGKPLTLRVDGIPREMIEHYAQTHPKLTYGYVDVSGANLTCTRLMDSGTSTYLRAGFWIKTALRGALLIAIAGAVWIVVIGPVLDSLSG